MSRINGVLGPIDSTDLGFTLMHEHILVVNWSTRQAFESWYDRSGHIEHAVSEVRAAQARGVKTIVDLTPINLGRDIHVIREVAERCEMQVIAATGFYWTEEPWMAGWEVDRLVEFLVSDIDSGAVQLEVFAAEGVDLSRVVIGHCGDSDDIAKLEGLLAGENLIGMDRFGVEAILPTGKRVETIAELCRRGYAAQLVLSHDACCHMDFFPDEMLKRFAPEWNFRHIPDTVIPALQSAGVSEAHVRQMTVGNPRRYFERAAVS